MSRLKDTDDFGNRMKSYEAVETKRKFDVHLPVYARIDGRSFSKFTKGMHKPFDSRMLTSMIETTKFLVEKTNANIGYVQSDEISLVWKAANPESDIFFSGKIQKMCSVLASMAAAKFGKFFPDEEVFPHFDCRVIQLPSETEAANMILWRVMDARKNAIQQIAQSMFSPKQLHGLSQKDILKILPEGCYESFGLAQRYGIFVKRATEKGSYQGQEVLRNVTKTFSIKDFNKFENREGLIFEKDKSE